MNRIAYYDIAYTINKYDEKIKKAYLANVPPSVCLDSY